MKHCKFGDVSFWWKFKERLQQYKTKSSQNMILNSGLSIRTNRWQNVTSLILRDYQYKINISPSCFTNQSLLLADSVNSNIIFNTLLYGIEKKLSHERILLEGNIFLFIKDFSDFWIWKKYWSETFTNHTNILLASQNF